MKRLLAGFVLAGSVGLLALPPAAHAEPTTAVSTTSTGPPDDPLRCATARDQADEALTRLRVPRPAAWTIEWRCGSPGWGARADLAVRTITVWVETRGSVRHVEWTLAHELGHAYDFETMIEEDRYAWRRVRGLTEDTAWWTNASLGQFTHEEWISDPAEDFAEAFAWCWLGDDPGPASEQITPPSQAQCRLVAGLTGVPVPAQ